MQIHRQGRKTLSFGQSGFGKTTYLIRDVKNSNYAQYFIFDHKLEFAHRESINPYYSSDELVEAFIKGEKYLAYSPIDEFPGADDEGFRYFCDLTYSTIRARDKGSYLFVCDEVNTFTDGYNPGVEFNQIIKDGRLWGIDFAGTAHAANQISNRLRLQLTEIVAFRTQDASATKFLSECGFDIEQVQSLEVGEFILKDCFKNNFHQGHLFKLTGKVSPSNTQTKLDEDTQRDHNPISDHSRSGDALESSGARLHDDNLNQA